MRSQALNAAPSGALVRNTHPGSFWWLLGHEQRLTLRTISQGTGKGLLGQHGKLIFWAVLLAGILHLAGLPFVTTLTGFTHNPSPADLMQVSFFLAMGFAILTARSLDGVTHLLYNRADLDLLLSSPMSQRRMFSARLVAVGLQTLTPGLFFTAPFVNIAIFQGDLRWLGLYPLAVLLCALSTCLAAALATLMFATIGAKRTRVVAQVVATVLATGIGIAAQINRLVSDETQEWMADKMVDWSHSSAFAVHSPLVWPVRGLLGDPSALFQLAVLTALVMALTSRFVAGRLAANAVTALGADMGRRDRGRSTDARRGAALFMADAAAMLRRKERLIALRSPWLVGELLTPLVYLVPPVIVLTKTAGTNVPPLWLMASSFTMLASQIAAGVSRLMISGEDAPELVATAPVTQAALDWAKIATVIQVAAILLCVPLAMVFWQSALAGWVGTLASLTAILCVCFIHLWFRTKGKRQTFYGKTQVPISVSIADQLIGLAIASTAGFAIRANPLAIAPLALGAALMIFVRQRRIREG